MSIEINILHATASLQDASTASPYDTVWAQSEIPVQQPEGIERVMLSEDKLFVVLAVVLIIWMGIVWMLFRTDRRLRRLEEDIADRTTT
jgi:CcmD family protein